MRHAGADLGQLCPELEALMQSKRSNAVVKSAYADGQFTFTIAGFTPLVLEETSISEANAHRAFQWGIIKRVVNKAALSRDEATGKSETSAEKYAEIKRMVDHFASGSEAWGMGPGAGFDNSATILAAIARVKSYSVKMAETFVGKFAAAEYAGDVKAALKYLATGKQVALAMLELRQERLGTAAIDADAALNEIPDAE